MKPATFTETVVLYEGMIVNQIKKLGIYQDHEEYYQCGLIGLWYAYERYEEGKGSFPAYAVITVRGYILERHIISERFFVGKKMGEIACEMGMTYYQVRWIYRQALEKMRDSVKG
ncbi:sigma factor [Bacillus toyonensis]|uniref:RNA polymerase subunit sigma-70 n=1 Tax=Bacillus toyonensis TaxID=155322 RepID=A0A2B5WUG6_9BACI|nr:sigma factor [Bacillus toyonensis]PGA87746.1 RNA polymerase subunit sigma-70 [Bacillus toyonensis]PHD56924.1 RNA polymerase subunit sigma-70 [Bacillus toyonensis]